MHTIYKMMKCIFTFLILLFNNFVIAQTNIVDTLKRFTYLELKNKFYDYYDHEKIIQAKAISKYYLQKAKKEKNNIEIAEGYNLIHFTEDFPTSLKYTDSITVITKNIKGNLYPARTYLIKGNLYYKHNNLKAALDNYVLGLKYAKEQHDRNQIAYANMNIAYLNSYMGKNVEAAKTFRYYLYNENDITDEYQHNQMRVSLINSYIEINKLDSANILIREGLNSPFVNKNQYSNNQYLYLEGWLNFKEKKYNAAIDKLLKAHKYFSSINDNNANYVLYILGKCYNELGDSQHAVQYFTALDSNIRKNSFSFLELREVYTYLINYYKEKSNKEKQLYFIDRFLKVDKTLDEQFRYLSVELPKKYDTPNLLQEKEEIINGLKNRRAILYTSIGILLLILLLLTYLYYKAKKTEKNQKRIALDLIRSIENRNLEISDTTSNIVVVKESVPIEFLIKEGLSSDKLGTEFTDHKKQTEKILEELEDKAVKTIPENVIQLILKELDKFETKEFYLKKGITLGSLAKNLKTNTAYLSEIINTHKGKNFAAYLNELRINYALNKLVIDKRFRSYKLSVIAEELGYNNEQAFSLAFKKKTGTTLSIYIKEIENTHLS